MEYCGKANIAKQKTEEETAKEKVQIAVIGSYGEDGAINLTNLSTNLRQIEGLIDILSDGKSIMNNTIEKLPIEVIVDGYIFEINKNGNVVSKLAKPVVRYTLDKEEPLEEGTEVTVTVLATISKGSITKITTPGGEVRNKNIATFSVKENGIYEVTVEGSSGEITTCEVTVLNIGNTEIFSKIYTQTEDYKDKNGNIAKIPKGFAVGMSTTINTINGGLVITDAIDEKHKSTGNQFVWIPVGKVNVDEQQTQIKTINLDRYYFDSEGNPSSMGEASIKGDKYRSNTEKTDNKWGTACARNLSGFKTSAIQNGGYYIGRYEAGDSSVSNFRTTFGETGQLVCKSNQIPYDNVTQLQASNIVKKMYTESYLETDLVNSYAWDTALVFIQEFSGDKKYSRQETGQAAHTKTGNAVLLDKTIDKRCNVFDMAGNCREWSTEWCNADYPATYRGGYCKSISAHDLSYTPAYRDNGSKILSSAVYSFRPLLYLLEI